MVRKRHRDEVESSSDAPGEKALPQLHPGAAPLEERAEEPAQGGSAAPMTLGRTEDGMAAERTDEKPPPARAPSMLGAAGRPEGGMPSSIGSTTSAPMAPSTASRPTALPWVAALIGGLFGGAAVAVVWVLASRDQALDAPLSARFDGIDRTLAVIEGRLQAAELRAARVEELGQAVKAAAHRDEDMGARIDAVAGATADLQQRLDELAEGLADLTKQVEPLLALARTVQDIGGAVTQLRSRALELTDQLAGLEEKFGRLPTREQAATLAEAIQQLRSALETSRDAQRSQTDALRAIQSALLARLERVEAAQPQLHAALEALQEELTAVAGQARQVSAGAEGMQAALDQRMAALAGDLASRTTTLRDEIAARIAGLEQQVTELREARLRDLGALLAATEIAAAANDGRPYAKALELLRQVAGDRPELADVIEPLGRFAGEGIPTLARLSARFEELAPGMGSAPERGPQDLLAATRHNLSSLLIVRRRDEPPGQADAAIEVARKYLARGEVESAARVLTPLAEAGKAAARDWLQMVEARRRALAALDRLTSLVRERLTGATKS